MFSSVITPSRLSRKSKWRSWRWIVIQREPSTDSMWRTWRWIVIQRELTTGSKWRTWRWIVIQRELAMCWVVIQHECI